MRIGILTSSRADFGIYLPLIKRLKDDSFFKLNIIAFGTHLSPFHGETIKQIYEEGFDVKYKVESMLLTDSAEAISTAVGLTIIKFADFWHKYQSEFDLVFCLGDRYEMFAAVSAGIPFQIPFAHLHGGETTLGAIDNVFRHCITMASKLHFVATNEFALKVAQLIGTEKNIYNVGALSLDNLMEIKLLSPDEFKLKWGIDLSEKTILTTFHPETVQKEDNVKYAFELVKVINNNQDFQFLITMPNADTMGNEIRKIWIKELENHKNVSLIENLGTQSYFTAMKYCTFLLGNTSSGIIEAASFQKYVINIGERQKGRACSENVFHVAVDASAIQEIIKNISDDTSFSKENIYFKADSAVEIVKQLKLYAA